MKGFEYRHFPDLGGLRKPRPDSPNNAWKNAAFRGYADHMQTKAFCDAVEELLVFGAPTANEETRAAVMCAEAVWWRCHRMLLSDALLGRGVDVQHILSDAKTQPHRLTPFAKVSEAGEVSYPGLIWIRRTRNPLRTIGTCLAPCHEPASHEFSATKALAGESY